MVELVVSARPRIQLCKAKGARVIATAGSDDKASFAKNAGADHAVLYRSVDFGEQVLNITQGKSADVIFDCVGQAVLDGNLRAIRPGGQIIYYGSASGHSSSPGDKILGNRLRVQGFVIFAMFGFPLLWSRGVSELNGVLLDGSLKLQVTTMRMNQVAEAHKLLEARKVQGKIVLDMAD